MKRILWVLLAILFTTSPVWAEIISEGSPHSESIAGTTSDDTSTVDLSDKDTDQPVQSPSFENTTPAGQAPGGPIES